MKPIKLSKLEKKLIDRLSQVVTSSGSLLEVGCGAGKTLLYLKDKYNMEVAGVDIYQPFIDNLNKNGVKAIIGDCRKLSFEDQSFDWVLIANSIHHIPNPEAAVSEALRVSKIGVIVVDPWYDKSMFSQQLSAELGAWCKKLHQSLGYFHREGLSAGEIIAAINYEVSNIEVDYELVIEELDIEALMETQKEFLDKLNETHYLLWELKQIRHKLNDHFITEPGQVVVTIWK